MNPWGQLAVIAAVSLLAAGGTFWIKGPPNRLFRCDPASLKQDEVCLETIPAGADVLWVDARPRRDWEKSGVPGSLLWNLDPAEDMQAFEAAAAVRVVATPRVIVYCGDENCGVSRQVAGRIRGLDLGAEVFVLRGGWRALREAGRVKGF
ncbi:MAG: rhodanese-like domain-containing protein [Verrucomicrobia bacterium]|nr:rhodanese-like domain-containing protein [Verrucomicrobiota bacterium]